MAKSGTGTKRAKIDALKHKDKRVNIPTRELRDFVDEDEQKPKSVLYPRDPSLDPQLVWKGKDEQDAQALEVPAVPIYIQEKIHPQAIVEDLRQTASGQGEPQMAMFADFNGISFETLIDFYQHEQNWTNRMILGDSLLVMNSLAEKEGLRGKVQMIYFDPPYGIRFGSNWQVSTRKREVTDGKPEEVNREPEVIKAFRDTWEYGIHSYLAYLRDRLVAAHELLTESGSVFVQIGDDNVHLVRCLLDEIFGSQNFVSLITYAKTTGATVVLLPGTADYVLWYAKNKTVVKYRRLYSVKSVGGDGGGKYDQVQLADGSRRALSAEEKANPRLLPSDARVYRFDNLMSQSMGREKGEGAASWFEVQLHGRRFTPNIRSRWKTNEAGMQRLIATNRIATTGETLAYVRFIDDFPAYPITNTWMDIGGIQSRSDPKVYVVQTATNAVERCVLMTTDPGDLVLDPTCGSGTTAYVAEHWGRRWMTCDTSRVALALARTRLMAARFPYYVLADSPEGVQKEAELSGAVPARVKTDGDVRRGFIYERVPHVMLKSIVSNDEIDTLDADYQAKLDPIRQQLNAALKQKWEESQVPRVADKKWPEKATALHGEWWQLRRERQAEIDASIARHADTELLCDQPYEDPKRIRVTGPFTVESLSPHRVLAPEQEQTATHPPAQHSTESEFVQMILDNLRKAGIQNTVKNERLKFDRLEPYAGVCINAVGEYTEGGKSRRAGICIGPQYGTVGPDLVKEAAKEAVQGIGFDMLVVGGLNFDPHVYEEKKRYGKLVVLTPRINADLLMGEELLKKTGAANLFMEFGEPDVEIKKQKDGNVVVRLKGVDVYDPTTGEIRNSSTDDIACWFIDTAYNGESFFVRHAYFTGAGDPYEKLKKALRAEVDEAAWASLYKTESRPFPPPKGNGKGQPKIAIKVINHYGDEVMKVFTV